MVNDDTKAKGPEPSWPGATLAVNPHTAIGMELALGGLAKRGFIPSVVIDVGAALGAWTALASAVWPESHFVMVEPLEERRVPLETFRATRRATIDIFMCGLGDVDDVLPMGVSEFLFDSSFAYECAESRMVRVRTLDHLLECNRIAPPDLIKLDVQGFELKVLLGAERALEACSAVLAECNFRRFAPGIPTITEVITWMDAHGFMPYEVVEVLRRPFDGAMGQCDLMFVRKDHALASDSHWA